MGALSYSSPVVFWVGRGPQQVHWGQHQGIFRATTSPKAVAMGPCLWFRTNTATLHNGVERPVGGWTAQAAPIYATTIQCNCQLAVWCSSMQEAPLSRVLLTAYKRYWSIKSRPMYCYHSETAAINAWQPQYPFGSVFSRGC